MGTTERALDVLSGAGVALTLVDVGASLEPFPPFRPLLGRATYVGFDPDGREVHTESSAEGRRIVVDTAVVAEADRSTAHFFLTRNPTCSSTLRPAAAVVGDFLHAYRFDVVGEAEVPAATLPAALSAVGIDRVDWIKLDTQGTDMRLVASLDDTLLPTLMAVDAEPGFDRYYEGEDVFGDLHRAMVERGFWMSDLELTRAVRLRRSTFDEALGARTKLSDRVYEFALKTSPIAGGPRYLRTLASLARAEATRADYLRLWACAFFSGNHPYALDVAVECRERHGADADTGALVELSARRNRADARRNAWRLAGKLNVRNLRRFVTKPY